LTIPSGVWQCAQHDDYTTAAAVVSKVLFAFHRDREAAAVVDDALRYTESINWTKTKAYIQLKLDKAKILRRQGHLKEAMAAAGEVFGAAREREDDLLNVDAAMELASLFEDFGLVDIADVFDKHYGELVMTTPRPVMRKAKALKKEGKEKEAIKVLQKYVDRIAAWERRDRGGDAGVLHESEIFGERVMAIEMLRDMLVQKGGAEEEARMCNCMGKERIGGHLS